MDSFETADATEGVAIIGLSGRFPGANTIAQFWQNLHDGTEAISFFSDQELAASGINPAVLSSPDYVKARGILEGIELFDAPFFGYNPREAELLDPQQRFFLECAWEALENAGYDSETYQGQIAVYAGVGVSTYWLNNIFSNPHLKSVAGDLQTMIGNDKDFLPTRVSYKLNLKGPSVNVQTACSTSLVAVHMACQSLLAYQSDIALAGGVKISVPQKAGYAYQLGGINSPDGHCRTFDAKARGTVGGNGVGVVVLKRLEDALSDGDSIQAVIKGSAINNDGSLKAGFTAPSVAGQAEVIAEALAVAGIEPQSISYVEAHGTATSLGDPIEIAALTQAFRAKTERRNFCAVGSVKSNIGHLDTAAGVASLIKTVLSLKNGLLPPSLHFTQPNPQINFENSPFYVNANLSEWKTNGHPRHAGVSSFGVGGTNAHVVLEEAPAARAAGESRPAHLLVLSAKTSSALETMTANLAGHLKRHPALNLADVAHTLAVGRRAFNHRLMLVCHDLEDAVSVLETRDQRRVFAAAEASGNRPVVFMFSGQGAQYVNMARELYEVEPTFRAQVDRCARLLEPHLGFDLRRLLFPCDVEAAPATEQLKRTSITQPALFVIEYALAKLWMEWGIHPQAMIGHSLGEYVAACLAGVFSLEDALALVSVRGRMIQQLPVGAMLAIALPEKEIEPLLCGDLSLAAVNGPSQCVVSGPEDAINALEHQFTEREVNCHRLRTSHAFHSQMMEHILESFAEQVRKLDLKPPSLPYISNVTGTWIKTTEATDPGYWARHLRHTVRFGEGLRELFKEPERILLEVGPGQTLSALARQHPDKAAACLVLSSLRRAHDPCSDVPFLLNTVGRLWLAGAEIEWSGFYAHERRSRLPLPTYPFERERYWIAPATNHVNARHISPHKKPDIGEWFYLPSWKRTAPLQLLKEETAAGGKSRWMVFADACRIGSPMVKRLEQMGHDVITVKTGERFARLDQHTYQINPRRRDDYDALLRELRSAGQTPATIAHLWSITSKEPQQLEIQRADEYQHTGFDSLLFLAQTFGKQDLSAPLRIGVVSNNVQDVTGKENLLPAKATLLGPCKVIPQEYPNISCQAVDIDLEQGISPEKLAHQLIAELTTNHSEHVIAYRGNYRWVQTFEAARLENQVVASARLREGCVYLITGGLGRIGLGLARYLAQSARAKLVLVEGRALAEKDKRQRTATNDPETRREASAVRALEALGAEVLVLNADITDFEQMQGALALISERFGEICGVVHAVESIGARPVQLLTPETTASLLVPKMKETFVLDALLKAAKLDFFILCSSINSIVGGAGQAESCAANAFLDTFARSKFSACDRTLTVSINWDLWQAAEVSDGTPAPDEFMKTRAQDSEYGISPAEGLNAFSRILHQTLPQIVVSTRELQMVIEQHNAVAESSEPEELQQASCSRSSSLRPGLGDSYVAPNNETERIIVRLWQELLGIEQIGIRDDFFELGGHSLLAVQLMSQIRKIFNQEFPPSILFQGATVEHLASLLQSPSGVESAPSLVAIQPNGSKPPFYCVHPAGGNVLCYAALSRHLGQEQPFYGFQAQGLDGAQPTHTQVEEMAAHYLKALRARQPQGPYLLGGWSLGAVVAYEMASQILAQGEEVSLLALFDPLQLTPQKMLSDEIDATVALGFAQELGLTSDDVNVEPEHFLRLKPDEQLRCILEQAQMIRALPQDMEIRRLQHLFNIFRNNVIAGNNYVARAIACPLSIFKATERPPGFQADLTTSWSGLAAGGIEVYTIPGNHFTMFSDPHVRVLGEHLGLCLSRSESVALVG